MKDCYGKKGKGSNHLSKDGITHNSLLNFFFGGGEGGSCIVVVVVTAAYTELLGQVVQGINDSVISDHTHFCL